jgi:hypothetical protein
LSESRPDSRQTRRRVQVAAAIGGTAVVAATILTAAAGTASAATSTVSFPGSVPKWATTANDAGAPPSDPIVEGEIFLLLPDADAAAAEAQAVSTPGSGSFHKYLKPSDWISKYAPTKKAFSSVESYLKDNKFTINGEPASREYIVFRGKESGSRAPSAPRCTTTTTPGTRSSRRPPRPRSRRASATWFSGCRSTRARS